MKKRLRKKLRLREFQELGFTIDFDVQPSEAEESIYTALSQNLNELLLARQLTTCFGYGTTFVRAHPYQSVTEAQRLFVADWLSKQPKAINTSISPLLDYRLTQPIHRRKPKWRPN